MATEQYNVQIPYPPYANDEYKARLRMDARKQVAEEIYLHAVEWENVGFAQQRNTKFIVSITEQEHTEPEYVNGKMSYDPVGFFRINVQIDKVEQSPHLAYEERSFLGFGR